MIGAQYHGAILVGGTHQSRRQVGSGRQQHIGLGLVVLLGVLAVVPAHAVAQDLTRLPRKGTALSDLMWEFEQHAPLNLRPQDAFEYVVAEGIVVNRGPKETEDKSWTMARSIFAAWGEATIDVRRAVAVNSSPDISTGQWTFVERHAYFRDSSGRVVEPWWGQGTERYNRLRVGDQVIVVGVRHFRDNTFFYSPEFFPHFSVVFNVVVRASNAHEVVCVDAPWRAAGDGFWAGSRLVERVLPSEATPRADHCYEVSPDEAFDAIVKTVREGI